MPINRLVALLTPLFTTAATLGSAWVARHIGIHPTPDQLLAIETTVATSALGAAGMWLHGHQKYEGYLHELEAIVLDAANVIEPASEPAPLDTKPTPPSPTPAAV